MSYARKRKAGELRADPSRDCISLSELGSDGLSYSLAFLDVKSLARVELTGSKVLRGPAENAWKAIDGRLHQGAAAASAGDKTDSARKRVISDYRRQLLSEYATFVERLNLSVRLPIPVYLDIRNEAKARRHDFFVRFSRDSSVEDEAEYSAVVLEGSVRPNWPESPPRSYWGDEHLGHIRFLVGDCDLSRWPSLQTFLRAQGKSLLEWFIEDRDSYRMFESRFDSSFERAFDGVAFTVVAIDRKTHRCSAVYKARSPGGFANKSDRENPTRIEYTWGRFYFMLDGESDAKHWRARDLHIIFEGARQGESNWYIEFLEHDADNPFGV